MNRATVCVGILTLLLLATMLISIGVGAVAISPPRLVRLLLFAAPAGSPSAEATIIWQLRLPRVLLASLVGAALGCAGAGYQGLFRNPLADPFVIGASSGAALGATLAIVSGLRWQWLGLGAIPLAALLGALLAVAVVYALASVGREVPTLSLLLAGVAVSMFIGALVSLLMFLNNEKLIEIFSWLMGSLSGRSWPVLLATAPPVLVAVTALFLMSRSLDSLTFGEETATTLGMQVPRLRAWLVLAATTATAAAVAAGGIIGFVGLVAPHMARLLVGPRHAYVIPAAGLLGGLLLLLADDVARTIAAPSEVPVGIITALVGGPVFLYLLKLRQQQAW